MSLRGSLSLPFSQSPNNTFQDGFSNRLGQDLTFLPVPFQCWLSQPRQAPCVPQQAQWPRESSQGRGEAKGHAYEDKSPSPTCLGLTNNVPDLDCTSWDRCDRSIPRLFAAWSHPGLRGRRGCWYPRCYRVLGAPTACGIAQHPWLVPGLPLATAMTLSPSLQ